MKLFVVLGCCVSTAHNSRAFRSFELSPWANVFSLQLANREYMSTTKQSSLMNASSGWSSRVFGSFELSMWASGNGTRFGNRENLCQLRNRENLWTTKQSSIINASSVWSSRVFGSFELPMWASGNGTSICIGVLPLRLGNIENLWTTMNVSSFWSSRTFGSFHGTSICNGVFHNQRQMFTADAPFLNFWSSDFTSEAVVNRSSTRWLISVHHEELLQFTLIEHFSIVDVLFKTSLADHAGSAGQMRIRNWTKSLNGPPQFRASSNNLAMYTSCFWLQHTRSCACGARGVCNNSAGCSGSSCTDRPRSLLQNVFETVVFTRNSVFDYFCALACTLCSAFSVVSVPPTSPYVNSKLILFTQSSQDAFQQQEGSIRNEGERNWDKNRRRASRRGDISIELQPLSLQIVSPQSFRRIHRDCAR